MTRTHHTTDASQSLVEVEYRWPRRIPAAFDRKIAPDDHSGPLARQVVPSLQELQIADGFSDDPVGDRRAENGDGLLVKYKGRALLLTTPLCAVHCRYCFRREYRRTAPPINAGTRREALKRLAAMADIHEVILSGGDPLMLPNKKIEEMVTEIDAMPHIARIRFHTRMATAAPERIDDDLCAVLQASSKTMIVVTHVNHSDELDAQTHAALDKLRAVGVQLLNQSVLLKGVNDSADALVALSEKLIAQGVLPYYLHQLDRVTGAAHFEVPVEQGRELIAAMRTQCPGYMVPRYVVEIPGAASKVGI